MFWKKEKKKSLEDQDFDALREAIFPGGSKEKLFRAQMVSQLCNGKLLQQQALHIYTKAKVRFKLACWKFDGETHRGRTADELIQSTIDDSERKLSFLESVAVNAYVVFDKVDPVFNSYDSLKKYLAASFGSDTQGYDCDIIPFAIGEYGLEWTNPIPVRGIGGIQVYLRNLRKENGQKVMCKRVRAISEPNHDPVDEYDVFSEEGAFLAKLYICPYHQRISRKAPRGFKLTVPNSA